MGKLYTILTIIGILLCGYVGYIFGYNDGQSNISIMHEEELKTHLKRVEGEFILSYIEEQIRIDRKDEGGLFSTDYVNYLRGNLSNSALIAKAKNVNIKVEYFAQNKSKLGEEVIVISEYIQPGKTVSFNNRLNYKGGIDNFKYTLLEAQFE